MVNVELRDDSEEEKAQSHYTPDEIIPGTHWMYSEWFENGALQQCRVQLETLAVNGSHSTINVSVLSKGSLVLAIKDDDWKHRINSVFGWSAGKQFTKVLLHLKDGRIPATAEIVCLRCFLSGFRTVKKYY
jgi:hypothetical protein